MKNASGSEVKITWLLKDEDSLYTSPFFISNSRELTFRLKPQSPYNEVKMSFGIGSWPADTLKLVLRKVQSLEIRSASGTMKLEGTQAVYDFLAIRRTGLGRRNIRIIVTE